MKSNHRYRVLPAWIILAVAMVGAVYISCSRPAASQNSASSDREEIVNFVYRWASAWESNVHSIDHYQTFYDPNFWSEYKSRSGMDYNRWMADKAAKGKKASCIRVEISEIRVNLDQDFATVDFMQRYVSNSYCDYGPKTLYLVRNGGQWRIIGEEQSSISKCGERCGGPDGEKARVSSTVYRWAAAWEKNTYSISEYRSFYHPSFWSNYKAKSGMDLDQWMADKAAKGKKASCIRVKITGLQIDLDNDFATATFNQRYISNSYCDYGTKYLYMIKTGGEWKIVGEEQPGVKKCSERCG